MRAAPPIWNISMDRPHRAGHRTFEEAPPQRASLAASNGGVRPRQPVPVRRRGRISLLWRPPLVSGTRRAGSTERDRVTGVAATTPRQHGDEPDAPALYLVLLGATPRRAGIDPVRRSPKSPVKTVCIGVLGCRCTQIRAETTPVEHVPLAVRLAVQASAQGFGEPNDGPFHE